VTIRIDKIVIAGIFSLDGSDFEVENNVWLVGDDERVVVVDAPHDPGPILAAVAGRRVDGIVCTHGHNDHVNAAAALADATGAPIALHPDDEMLWATVHPSRRPDMALADGQVLEVGGTALRVLHTPGHSPGGVCLHLAEAGVLFSGDTLFSGGPGATGRSFSDFATIIDSIRTRLLVLPPETVVHTGHGDSTTIGAEAPSVDDWIARGH
jgi:glyoxylase-like metal-dependent hydrolase (beta-lactamase superfamily II)